MSYPFYIFYISAYIIVAGKATPTFIILIFVYALLFFPREIPHPSKG